MLELGRVLELEVVRRLPQLLAVSQPELALMHQALLVDMARPSKQALEMAGAEAAREGGIIRMAEDILEKVRKK